MKKKAESGLYTNGHESFQIDKTEKDEIMTLHAITQVSYFPLKKGDTIPLNIETVESLINDKELGYKQTK